jgi:hypothetical protein
MVWTVNVGVKESACAAWPRATRGRRATALCTALVTAVVASAGGCAWLRWRELARTHVDLLERMATDAADTFSARPQELRPADIERMRYPLSRAREFAASSRSRFEDAEWVTRFDRLLTDYDALVGWLDRARTRNAGPRERDKAVTLTQQVRDDAAAVREALDALDS